MNTCMKRSYPSWTVGMRVILRQDWKIPPKLYWCRSHKAYHVSKNVQTRSR
jgi:hypothetical protein